MTARTCVIYNPAAGRGRAEQLLDFIRKPLAGHGADYELRPTDHPGHAVDLAMKAADEGFTKVVAAGGDGTVHEVANGLLRGGNREVMFAVWPIGSANDYAYTLGMTQWMRAVPQYSMRQGAWRKGRSDILPAPPLTDVIMADVGRVTGGGRERFFVANFGLGFNGMVNAEARKTRWLSGLPLYAWAFLKAIVRHFATPRMTIRFDDWETTGPTLALSVLLAQREGNFPLRPAASLTDGLFDTMHATRLRRWHLVRYLPAMARGTLPEDHPLIRLGRARCVTVASEAPLCAHADGEFFCVPEDGVRELAVEVVPARLRVEVYPPGLYGGRVATKAP
jgi:diacylglycerol kinase (ATP)